MRFRGKIIGAGKSLGAGTLILFRPYSIEDETGYYDTPTTAEGLARKIEDAGLLGKKVRITIEEE